jgi:hypothetical protein
MARPKGTQKFMGKVKAALRLGFPLTVREVAKWAGCDRSTAGNLLLELEGQGKAMHYKPRNAPYLLWLAVTTPAMRNDTGLMLIAKRFHTDRTTHQHVTMGANFVECMECGKHAHTGSDLERPLVWHGSEHRSGSEFHAVRCIRPQDF